MPTILRSRSAGAARFTKVVSLSGGLTFGSTLEGENHCVDSLWHPREGVLKLVREGDDGEPTESESVDFLRFVPAPVHSARSTTGCLDIRPLGDSGTASAAVSLVLIGATQSLATVLRKEKAIRWMDRTTGVIFLAFGALNLFGNVLRGLQIDVADYHRRPLTCQARCYCGTDTAGTSSHDATLFSNLFISTPGQLWIVRLNLDKGALIAAHGISGTAGDERVSGRAAVLRRASSATVSWRGP